MRFGLSGGAVLALAAVAGCGDAPEPEAFSVADSAGVEVVTNLPTSLDVAATWSLADEAHVEIGTGTDAETPLYRVSSVLPIEGGLVVVGLASPPRAIVFDATGSPIRTLGGPGEGPGEFLSVGSVVPLDDGEVGVWDPYRRRLSRFDPSGEHLEDLDLTDVVPQSPGGAASSDFGAGYTHLTRVGDALIVFTEGAMGPGPESGVYRPALPSVRLSLSGELTGTFGHFPGIQLVAPLGLPQPFGPRTYAAVTPDQLVVGTGASAEFWVASPDGDVVRIVRWPHEPTPATGDVVAEWDAFLDQRPELSDLVSELPRPTTLPAHSDIVSSDDGFIFVSEYPGPVGLLSLRRADDAPEGLRPLVPVSERRWFVFSEAGVLVASVTTPAGFEPQRIVDGSMWGVFEDDLGVESAQAYRIIRP